MPKAAKNAARANEPGGSAISNGWARCTAGVDDLRHQNTGEQTATRTVGRAGPMAV